MSSAKEYLTNLLRSGHRHAEVSEALRCSKCGIGIMKYEAEAKRLREENPQEFKRVDSAYIPSERTKRIGELLEQRIRTDKAYRKELEGNFTRALKK